MVTVVVRNSFGGVPVPGTELRWVALDEQHFKTVAIEPDLYEVLVREELFQQGPVLASTDAQGRASFANPAARGFLCASAADMRGCKLVSPNPAREVNLEIFRDWPIDVAVVDPSGASLEGLGVCLRYASGNAEKRSYFDALQTRVPLKDGRARLDHAGLFQGRLGYDRKFFVGLTGWVGAPLQVEIPAAGPPQGPILISLPPSGSLELRVTDESGAAAAPLGPLWIGASRLLQGQVESPEDLSESRAGWAAVSSSQGTFLLRHVEPAVPLRAFARRNEDSALSKLDLRGPAQALATERVAFALGSGCVSLRGRILWPDRQPLQEWDLKYLLRGADFQPQSTGLSYRMRRLLADGNGRFVVDLEPASLAGPGRELVLAWLKLPESLPFIPGVTDRERPRDRQLHALAATVALDPLWAVGVHDLGDLVLAPFPIFASGTVVDSKTRLPLPSVTVVVRNVPVALAPWDLNTDEQGHFELRAWTLDAAVLDLEFWAPGRLGGESKLVSGVRRGTFDLLVELETP